MIDKDEIQKMLLDLENDRVERTLSTTNTDKFGQAICAFANDLPNHCAPGYLILGVDDDGNVRSMEITDELLKNMAAIRTDGNIQPQPSMVVEKVELNCGTVVVVEVQPAVYPPVKYKGRVWVRVGPRKGVANEADEKRLIEKRACHVSTFDALPCLGATLADIEVPLFRQSYLPKAMPEDVIAEDKRDVRLQMQSLGFYDMKHDCPTYAGIILFGKNVERTLPGAYVQYVRFKGTSRVGDVMREYKFSGNLMKILYQLDTFVDTTVSNRRPVPVSALREKIVTDYPQWAIRELLMNAVCHRDYESNGPIQFYQYDDRVEILNPGGLYGKVNATNFPLVNDYRNGVVAEAMKVLGFVNRFSRGVLRVEDELIANNNGSPDFKLYLETAFLVVVRLSENAVVKDINERADFIPSADDGINDGINDGKECGTVITDLHKSIYQAVCMKPSIKYTEIADNLGVSESTITRAIRELKARGYIARQGARKSGEWIVLKRME